MTPEVAAGRANDSNHANYANDSTTVTPEVAAGSAGSGSGGGGSGGGGGSSSSGSSLIGRGGKARAAAAQATAWEHAARRYIAGGYHPDHGGSGSSGAAGGTASEGSGGAQDGVHDGAVDDDCCICQEGLADGLACEEHGEPLVTACGHRFHAVCFARFLETTGDLDPVCPMCRSANLAVRFTGM